MTYGQSKFKSGEIFGGFTASVGNEQFRIYPKAVHKTEAVKPILILFTQSNIGKLTTAQLRSQNKTN